MTLTPNTAYALQNGRNTGYRPIIHSRESLHFHSSVLRSVSGVSQKHHSSPLCSRYLPDTFSSSTAPSSCPSIGLLKTEHLTHSICYNTMHKILIENKDKIKDSHKDLIHIVNFGTDNYYFLNHTYIHTCFRNPHLVPNSKSGLEESLVVYYIC